MDARKSVAERQRILRAHLEPEATTSREKAGSSLQMRSTSAGDSAAYLRRTADLDDVVVVSALRTPQTKAKRGAFKDTPADELLRACLEATLQQTGVEPEAVGDLVVGTVLAPGSQRAIECRIAMILAGFPNTVPIKTVNRQCSSGIQAVADVASAIKAGFYNIGIAAGVESMTTDPMGWGAPVNPGIKDNQEAADCMLPMGITSENVAAKYGVDRGTQDKMAAQSHARAAAATKSGRFRDEIVSVATVWKDPKTGEEKRIVVSEDDGIREGVTPAALSKLPAVFKKGGSTTAGNSSQVSDGASAVLLMTRREALRRSLPMLGVFRSFAAVGVDPAVMGIGPSVAIPAAVKSAGLTIDDIDLYELNEAFASQATFCVKKLGLDMNKVNVNGGAIALGHPLGSTGSRCTATLLHEMKKRGKSARFGVVSMCIGSGMGAACVFEQGGAEEELRTVRTSSLQSNLSRDAK